MRHIANALAVVALSCRSYDFRGARCDPADGRCPGGYVCAAHRDFPERGNQCIFEAKAQNDRKRNGVYGFEVR